MSPDANEGPAEEAFGFRPWVRRAGLSIIVVAAIVTALMAMMLHSPFRYGWVGEPFSWIYVTLLWMGGLRIYRGTLQNAAVISGAGLLLRPLHRFTSADIEWAAIKGTEQMMGGDRLIVYYERGRGLRFIAMNLNLVRGRRQFTLALDEKLRQLGFAEKVVERSRYLTRIEPPLVHEQESI